MDCDEEENFMCASNLFTVIFAENVYFVFPILVPNINTYCKPTIWLKPFMKPLFAIKIFAA